MTVKELREALNSLDSKYDDIEIEPAGKVTAYHFSQLDVQSCGIVELFVDDNEDTEESIFTEPPDIGDFPYHFFLD